MSDDEQVREQVRELLARVSDPSFLLETLFTEAPVGFAIWRADGHPLLMNRAYRELFGAVPPPEYDIFQDEIVAAQGLAPLIRRAFEGERCVLPPFWYDPRELRHIRSDGKRVAIEVTLVPLPDRAGGIPYVALCYRDVTERLELERDIAARAVAAEALRVSEERYRTAFELAPEALFVYDLDGLRIDDVNESALRLFGLTREGLLALPLGALSVERQPDGRLSREVGLEHVVRAMLGERPEFEWMFRGPTGEDIPCEVRLVRLPAVGRNLCRVAITDLRERQRLAEERERSRALEEQNLHIRETDRLKSSFLATMSHELRTPMNSIIGFAELIHDGLVAPTSSEHREFIGDILKSGRHLLRLINDILDLAKVEAGKLDFHPQPVVVVELISEVVAVLRALAVQKAIRVGIEVAGEIGVAVLDPNRFKQVLYNYLSNALKFTPEGGRVCVRARGDRPGWFRIEVEDTGAGIPDAQLPKLFTEFQRLDATRAQPGTGLGLALTGRIVEAQGGTVGVSSCEGGGCVFYAVLPLELPA